MSFIPLFLAALVSSSGDEVVARVDGVTITRGAVSRRVEGFAKKRETVSPVAALETLIADALLSAEASRLGLGDSPQIAGFVDRAVRTAAAEAMVESFAGRRAPEEATLRKMFHDTADFVAYEYLSYASEADARAARSRIDGGAPLAEEAKRAVAARLHPNAAEAPLAMRAQVGRKLAEALFAAAPGGIAGPVEDDKGWVVARVVRKQVGTDAEYAARRPALVESVHKQTVAAARSHLADQLKAKTAVKLDEAFLSSLPGAEATKQQLEHVIATVAGVPVRYAEVHAQVAALGRQAAHMGSPAVKIQLANGIVTQRLLEAFALEQKFDQGPAMTAHRAELRRNGLAAVLASRIEAAVKPPSSRDVEKHYRANAARYQKPLADVRPRVEAELLRQRRGDAVQAKISELRAKASISIDEAALARASS